jgi:Zn-dependent protease
MDAREVLDLLVSTIVVFLAFSINHVMAGNVERMLAYLLATATAFLLHELAHRGVARSRGVYAVYRAWYPGLLLALVFAIGTRGRFAFVAPGAVEIYMPIYIPGLEATIAVAGPIVNTVVALTCLLLVLTQEQLYSLTMYAYTVGYVNAFLAFFNLLPIPPLDGFKVLRASWVRWLTAFTLAVAMLSAYVFLL